jgi:glycosyltransferase involved in cell wall biosynthesis
MACGTPVIGSDVGGIKYSVADGKTGFLVPPKDPDALAEKIELLISNPALHQQMKKAAIQRVKDNFTWQKVAALVSDLYKQIQVPALVSKSRSQDTMNKKSQAA